MVVQLGKIRRIKCVIRVERNCLDRQLADRPFLLVGGNGTREQRDDFAGRIEGRNGLLCQADAQAAGFGDFHEGMIGQGHGGWIVGRVRVERFDQCFGRVRPLCQHFQSGGKSHRRQLRALPPVFRNRQRQIGFDSDDGNICIDRTLGGEVDCSWGIKFAGRRQVVRLLPGSQSLPGHWPPTAINAPRRETGVVQCQLNRDDFIAG